MAQRKKTPTKRPVPRAANPPQLTEDEEDGIMMKRLIATEKPIPLQKVLDRYGYTVER